LPFKLKIAFLAATQKPLAGSVSAGLPCYCVQVGIRCRVARQLVVIVFFGSGDS